jgi:hypothetical protein
MERNRMTRSVRSFVLLAAVLAVWSGAKAQEDASGGPPGAPEQAVLRLESERCHAMERADTLALGRLLAPDLTYVHSNGIQDGRRSLLGKIASKAIEYESISPERSVVRILGPTAIVTGVTLMKVKARGQELTLHSIITSVYVRNPGAKNGEDGDGPGAHSWKLEAYQSTSMPEK